MFDNIVNLVNKVIHNENKGTSKANEGIIYYVKYDDNMPEGFIYKVKFKGHFYPLDKEDYNINHCTTIYSLPSNTNYESTIKTTVEENWFENLEDSRKEIVRLYWGKFKSGDKVKGTIINGIFTLNK